MKLYHLFILVHLHFTKSLLKRNDEYVLVPHLENRTCTKYSYEFVNENVSMMQCMALCLNRPSCSHICYVRDIGRCIGCSSAKMLTLEPGSRVFLKVSDRRERPPTHRNDRPSTTSDRHNRTNFNRPDGPSITTTDSGCLRDGGINQPEVCPKKKLIVSNGGHYGVWSRAIFCKSGVFAVGYALKIQAPQLLLDDTAVNGLGLQCVSINGIHTYRLLKPGEAEFGSWSTPESCGKVGHAIKAFQMQVEEDDFLLDASSMNFVRFRCAPLHYSLNLSDANTIEISPGYGFWGSYGNWSEQCGYGHGVCGIKVKIDETHESDRTGLNDVILYCC